MPRSVLKNASILKLKHPIKKSTLIELVVLLAIVLLTIVYFFHSHSSTSISLIDESDLSEGVAVVVNDIEIGEAAITAYIADYRQMQGLENDDNWAAWLVDNGFTSEKVRRESIEMFVSVELERQYARKVGANVNSAEVEKLYRETRQSFETEEEWELYLRTNRLGTQGYLQGLELIVLDKAICEALSLKTEVNDGELLLFIKKNNSAFEAASSLSDLSETVIESYRLQAELEKRETEVTKLIEQFRSESSIQISPMPSNLPYDVGLSDFRSLDLSSPESRLHKRVIEGTLPENGEAEAAIDHTEIIAKLKSLMDENPDVFGWIFIPGTNVSLPLVQHETDDEYYLQHNEHKAVDTAGVPFIGTQNSRELSESVSVIYGHSSTSREVAFTQLHKFEDQAFFDEHEDVYIILGDRLLKYKIISAFVYDSRDILSALDPDNTELLQQYYDYFSNPGTQISCARTNVALDANTDRVLLLSTCLIPSDADARYLVFAVLEDEVEELTDSKLEALFATLESQS